MGRWEGGPHFIKSESFELGETGKSGGDEGEEGFGGIAEGSEIFTVDDHEGWTCFLCVSNRLEFLDALEFIN